MISKQHLLLDPLCDWIFLISESNTFCYCPKLLRFNLEEKNKKEIINLLKIFLLVI